MEKALMESFKVAVVCSKVTMASGYPTSEREAVPAATDPAIFVLNEHLDEQL